MGLELKVALEFDLKVALEFKFKLDLEFGLACACCTSNFVGVG